MNNVVNITLFYLQGKWTEKCSEKKNKKEEEKENKTKGSIGCT